MNAFIDAYLQHPVIYSVVLLMLICIGYSLIRFAIKVAIIFVFVAALIFFNIVMKDSEKRTTVTDTVKSSVKDLRHSLEPSLKKIGSKLEETIDEGKDVAKEKIKNSVVDQIKKGNY